MARREKAIPRLGLSDLGLNGLVIISLVDRGAFYLTNQRALAADGLIETPPSRLNPETSPRQVIFFQR